MYLNGVLLEARDLVNGLSVVQADHVDKVDYFHVELYSHDVLIAEGAFSESYVDDGNRGMFHNANEYLDVFGAAMPGPAEYCVPRHHDGYEVEAARRLLNRRAGLESTEADPVVGKLRGHVDVTNGRRIAGWAQNVDRLETPVCLDIWMGRRLLGRTLANRYRDDLRRAGLGSGHHGFEFPLPRGVSFTADTIRVCRSLDGEAVGTPLQAQRLRA